MQCIIIDDNSIARETISFLARQEQELKVIGEFSGAAEAFDFVQSNQVDLLFLDIELPGMNGIELTRTLADRCPVIIYISSKKDYALDAFELRVADYLVKPICPQRFSTALHKAREIVHREHIPLRFRSSEFVFLKEGNLSRRVGIVDICMAEAMGDYVKIYTHDKVFVIHTTLKSLEERLPSDRFLRVHRSYIIAFDKIEYMQESTVRLCEKFVPIAETYRKNLLSRMQVL